MGGQPLRAIGADGSDGDGLPVDLELDPLTSSDLLGGDGVEAGLEGDQGVLADPTQVLVGDQIRQCGQREQHGPVGLGSHGDDLTVGAMDLGAADRQPGLERPVQLGDRVEGPAGDHVVAVDVHLPLDPALAGGPIGSEHVDDEPVVLGERRRLWVQRDRPGATWRLTTTVLVRS